MTIRVSDIEYDMICELSKELGVSKAEVWRRLLWTVRVLYSSYLPVNRAFKSVPDSGGRITLADALKPIPVLFDEVLEEIEKSRREPPSQPKMRTRRRK